ncbi:MAG: hypothetical protein K0B87_05435 [Candidatus Syntrophosphaera sp.]|nr:hypothetical protein [Candidatus Syntrophosphaera sp.]
MLFLKSLLFIVWNIALGTLLLLKVRWFLFNRRQLVVLGLKIPLTPGFLVRKRDWLFNKVRDILQDYLDQAENKARKSGYLNKWEEQIWQTVWDQTGFIDDWVFLPRGFKDKIHTAVASAVREVASKILRKAVPHFIEQWRVEHRIDEYDDQFSIDFFYKYFRQYVFKPLLLAFLAINLIIGVLNMALFLILA